MTYAVGALIIQSNIEMPAEYDIFHTERFSNISKGVVLLEKANTIPNLSNAKKRATHELMTVWETEDAWVFEGQNSKDFLSVSRDYKNAQYFSTKEYSVTLLRPLLQALVECCLVNLGTAIIHSSCIALGGTSVLFSAPSGTGKSERARLWVEHFGASWISGDRPAVRPERASVHGVPWDGKDQIFVNETVPIHAIVEIRRSDKTFARKMTLKQKRMFLSSQLFIPMWDPILVQKAFLSMKQIINLLPIYRLYCDISEESIQQAYDLLYHHPEKILEAKEETTMQMKKDFTIVDIGGDYMAVPVGENATTFGGTVVLNEVSAFVLKAMNKPVTEEELLELVLNEYDIDRNTAATDLAEILREFKRIGLVD